MTEPAITPAPGDQTVDPTLSGASRAITPAQRMDALRELNRGRSKLGFLWEWTKIFQVSVLLFLLIRTFLVEAFKIPSGSMENTLQVGDFLLVNKLVYGAEVPFTHKRLPRLRDPHRGDVIVFEYPEDPTKNFVKRLVAVPGDTVEMREGILIRNGASLAERYVEHTEPDMDPAPEDFRWQRDYLVKTAAAATGYHPSRNNWGPLVVPNGNYFVLGDNRDNSLDSRYWGFLTRTYVSGKAIAIYWSQDAETVIRWDRVGAKVR